MVAAFLQSLHPITLALQTSLQADLQTVSELLWDRPPTPFTAPISTESFISYSSKLFYHWVKPGGRSMLFSSFLHTSLSLCLPNPHMCLFCSRTLLFPASQVILCQLSLIYLSPASTSQPSIPSPNSFLHDPLPDGSCLFLSSWK